LIRRKYEEDVEAKKPWNGKKWGGRIVFRLENGSRYEVIRNFDKKTVQIIDEFGNDITGNFGVLRNGEVNFAEELFGINKTIFRSTMFITQNRIDELSDPRSLRNKIQAIVSSGSEDISSKIAIEKLENALNRIGTPQATRKPLGEAIKALRNLEDELEKSKATFSEIGRKLGELQDLENELRSLTQKEKEMEYSYLLMKRDEIRAKISEVEEIQKEVEKLQAVLREENVVEIDEKDFQTALATDTKMSSIRKRLDELKAKLDECREECRKIEEEIREFPENVEDLIRELNNLNTKLKVKREAFEKILNKIKSVLAAKDEISQNIADLSAFSTVTKDDLNNVLEYETRRQYHEEWVRAKKEKIEANYAKIKSIELSQKNKRIVSAVLILLGLLTVALSFSGFPAILLPAGIFLVVVGLLYLRHAGKSDEIESLKDQIREIQKELESSSFEDPVTPLFDKLGVKDKEEFLEKYEQYQKYVESLRRLEDEFEELLSEKNKVRREIIDCLKEIIQILSVTGYSSNVPEDDSEILGKIDELDSIIRRTLNEFEEVLEKRKKLRNNKELLSRYKVEFETLSGELMKLEQTTSEILAKYSVKSFEGLQIAYDAYVKSSEIRAKLERLRARMSGMLGDKTVEDLKSELIELDERIQEHSSSGIQHDYSSAEEIRKELENLREKIARVRENIRRIEGEISALEKTYRPVQEIEEEIEELKKKIDELKLKREAIEIAKSVLVEAEREFTRDFVRLLNQRISPVARAITGRYEDIRVNDNLEINVRDPDHSIFAECRSHLSRGTVDQLYFILKVAIAEMLTKDSEPLPLILDDVFANYDPLRLRNALDFLVDLSSEFQVILFTCHKEQVNLIKEIAELKGFEVSSDRVGEFEIVIAEPRDVRYQV